MKNLLRRMFIDWSKPITILTVLVALVGAYCSSFIELKLSLTDLLPQDHPSVVRFNKLVDIVGGVGYVEIVLHADDQKSHLEIAPKIVEKMKTNPLVRSAFFLREEHYFVTRALFYPEISKLTELQTNLDNGITKAKRKIFDIGLWDDEEKTEKEQKPVELDSELKKFADKTATLSPYLISKDKKDLLVMVKPSFDSLDMNKSKELVKFTEESVQSLLPPHISARYSGRYVSKVRDSALIEQDIYVLGILSNLVMAVILLIYFQSIRAVISIFIPVVLGLGITALATYLVIGHVNIITGFLVGIISGVGSDYGIHMLWRLRLEKREPSGPDPDPLWRTLQTAGWANFVTIISTGLCFFMMCVSSFKVFSEFGFMCGVGLTAILFSKLTSFYWTSKILNLEKIVEREKYIFHGRKLFSLRTAKSFVTALTMTGFLCIAASKIGFEFDFDKMMEHSKEIRAVGKLVDEIYDRSTVPSAIAASTKEEAIKIENYIKDKYMPHTVNNIVSGATLVPERQDEKKIILNKIGDLIRPIKDRQLESALGIPASAIRTWVESKPFTFGDIPVYVQEALRGTQQTGFLIYVYPTEHLNTGPAVARFAGMIKDVEKAFPDTLSGSDAAIFSDILKLIERDGIILFSLILIFVGVFIWASLRSFSRAVLCYVPFLVALPVCIGLMALFKIKFNIFNIALLPAFVAIGIEIPIQLMQRAGEIKSGFKAVNDIAVSLQLSLLTTAVGFGTLIFTRAGVLKSLGWMSIMATFAIWAIGLFLHPAILERFFRRSKA